jgi:hypothetical protein
MYLIENVESAHCGDKIMERRCMRYFFPIKNKYIRNAALCDYLTFLVLKPQKDHSKHCIHSQILMQKVGRLQLPIFLFKTKTKTNNYIIYFTVIYVTSY